LHSAVDFEVTEHAFYPVAHAIEALGVGDLRCAVRFWRNDRLYPAGFEIGTDRIGIVGLVGNKGPWHLLG
jgi:hypothetical protein